ncbi:hypothetical protein HJFPF1_04309 [Paramyrothecium foliicola]|nr:hypothetical protein HJFPF1_04309 [Paramyrothecium foliicola]
MQFSTGLLALALAISGTSAAPSAAIEERQGGTWQGFYHIQYFSGSDCTGTLLTADLFTDTTTNNNCIAPVNVGNTPYQSWRLRTIAGTPRRLRLTTYANCITVGGSAFTILEPTTPLLSCYNHGVGGGQFEGV